MVFSVPVRAVLSRHSDAGGIADLDPDAARARSIRAIDLLRHDALGARPARMGEHGRPILGDVFLKPDASLGIAQPRQRVLASRKWAIAHILAVMLDQIERIDDRSMGSLPSAELVEWRQTIGPNTTASPSIVKLLTLIHWATAAIAGSLAVQSIALRL
jgi:hypothetical protein